MYANLFAVFAQYNPKFEIVVPVRELTIEMVFVKTFI